LEKKHLKCTPAPPLHIYEYSPVYRNGIEIPAWIVRPVHGGWSTSRCGWLQTVCAGPDRDGRRRRYQQRWRPSSGSDWRLPASTNVTRKFM